MTFPRIKNCSGFKASCCRLLVTECEIFLSLIVKFLDPDKPSWQRALALELLHKLVIQPALVTEFCRYYDCQPHATNIFQDMINSLGAYVQVRYSPLIGQWSIYSLLIGQNMFIPLRPSQSQDLSHNGQTGSSSVQQPGTGSGLPAGAGPGVSAQPGFYYRGCFQPLVVSWVGGTARGQVILASHWSMLIIRVSLVSIWT